MGKAILVIDMPDSCDKCHICASYAESAFSIREYWCTAFNNKDVEPYTKPEWCPLKPVPSKYDMEYSTSDFEAGFNSCINEISGVRL